MRTTLGCALLGLFLLIASPGARANEPFFPESSTRLNGVYSNFGGESDSSLGSNTSGFGVELLARKGNSFLSLVSGFKFLMIQGLEPLLDGGTSTETAFDIFLSDAVFGLQLSLLPSKDLSLRPYLGVNGLLTFAQTRLEEKTYTDLRKSESAMAAGHELVAGFEFQPNRRSSSGSGRSIAYIFEARLRSTTLKILNQEAFQIQGLNFVFGLGF